VEGLTRSIEREGQGSLLPQRFSQHAACVRKVERLGTANHFGAGGTNLPPVLLHYKTDKAHELQ